MHHPCRLVETGPRSCLRSRLYHVVSYRPVAAIDLEIDLPWAAVRYSVLVWGWVRPRLPTACGGWPLLCETGLNFRGSWPSIFGVCRSPGRSSSKKLISIDNPDGLPYAHNPWTGAQPLQQPQPPVEEEGLRTRGSGPASQPWSRRARHHCAPAATTRTGR